MNGADFLDTNVVVYAYDDSNPRKQEVARRLLREGVSGKIVISTQVLGEFASTMLHKVSPPATADAVMKGLDALATIRLVVPDAELVRRAVQARAAYGIHFYDGMIVAAAERAGCQRILSEDLNAGQDYFGVTVSNPFR
ncbi:MAG TPA: PIN domain-containing protein [Terriglobales bacterium]|nr:PIN domain-containing protein [Terriglobales bacterium]